MKSIKKIISLLEGILEELKKLNNHIQTASSKDIQQEASQMINTIMESVSKTFMGGHNGK